MAAGHRRRAGVGLPPGRVLVAGGGAPRPRCVLAPPPAPRLALAALRPPLRPPLLAGSSSVLVGVARAGGRRTAWRRYAPASFAWLVRDPWWRRRVARWLRRSWPELMTGCGLSRGPHSHQEVPDRAPRLVAGRGTARGAGAAGGPDRSTSSPPRRSASGGSLEASRVRVIATSRGRRRPVSRVVLHRHPRAPAAFEQVPPRLRPLGVPSWTGPWLTSTGWPGPRRGWQHRGG